MRLKVCNVVISRSIFVLILISAVVCISGQKTTPVSAGQSVKSTPAYAEVLLRTTELTAELEALLVQYTEDYPRVKAIRLELGILREETNRLNAVRPSDVGRLTLALGKLILGKVVHAAALKRLQSNYIDSHPDVRREKKQVEIFEAAIKEILD